MMEIFSTVPRRLRPVDPLLLNYIQNGCTHIYGHTPEAVLHIARQIDGRKNCHSRMDKYNRVPNHDRTGLIYLKQDHLYRRILPPPSSYDAADRNCLPQYLPMNLYISLHRLSYTVYRVHHSYLQSATIDAYHKIT